VLCEIELEASLKFLIRKHEYSFLSTGLIDPR
jgi:hypothetical protein